MWQIDSDNETDPGEMSPEIQCGCHIIGKRDEEDTCDHHMTCIYHWVTFSHDSNSAIISISFIRIRPSVGTGGHWVAHI